MGDLLDPRTSKEGQVLSYGTINKNNTFTKVMSLVMIISSTYGGMMAVWCGENKDGVIPRTLKKHGPRRNTQTKHEGPS